MLPYCIDLSDLIEQLPESLSCDGCSNPPPTIVFYTFFCVCVCVCERESVCVCRKLQNSAEICVTIRKLAKTGDLGRVACGDFSCYCVLDACCPLTLLTATRPFLMLITCVCVCGCPYVSACLWLLLILVSTATGAVLCGCRCVCLVRMGSPRLPNAEHQHNHLVNPQLSLFMTRTSRP